MKKKSQAKKVTNFEPTKVSLMVAVVAVVSLVMFVLVGAGA